MDEFLNYVQNSFGFIDAVVLKNLFIGLAFFILGAFTMHLFASYLNSILIKDCKNDYKLDELGISMLVIRKNNKDRIVCHPNMTMRESFFTIVVLTLTKFKIIRNKSITKKDERKALIVFVSFSIICFIIVFIALLMTLTVQQPGQIYKFRELFGL